MDLMATQPGATSLSKLYSECMRHFQSFLLTLSETDCRVIHLGQVVLPEILEQYGRIKIWGDQSKADFPERARGSLDDTLRKDEELRSLVQAILRRLEGLLTQATNIASRKYDPDMGSDYDSISSVSADSDSSSLNEEEDTGNRMPKICLLVNQITEQIRSLFDLSALLRRPKVKDKYIRSIGSEKTSNLDSSETSSLASAFIGLDERHIVQKTLQWRGLTKSTMKFDVDVESTAPLENVSSEGGVEDIFWLCQRLARANTRRREQLRYWTDHPYDTKHNVPRISEVGSKAVLPNLATQSKDGSVLGSQASTVNQTKFKEPPAMPKSISSKRSFSTVAESDIHETTTDTKPKTVYAPTEIGQARSSSIPNPPKVKDGQLTFLCPYCGFALDSSMMRDRQSWKYTSPSPFKKRDAKHISIGAMYSEISDLTQRADDLNTGKEPCLVCGEELSLSALQKHLATHMEDIALFVLPTDVGEESGDSNASLRAAKLESDGQDIGAMSDTSSLGFSAAGYSGQTPAEFSSLLAVKEDEYHSPFSRPRWINIGERVDSSDIQATVGKLESKDWADRVAAVRALINQPKLSDRMIEAVTGLLHYPDPHVRCSAVHVLSSQSPLPRETLEEMTKRLEDEEAGGLTALAYASKYGHMTSVQCLLLLGSKVDCKGSISETPLYWAARYGHEAIVNLLLEAGADPNSSAEYGGTPLHGAAEHGHEGVVKLLLDQNANPRTTNESGETPMLLASKGEHHGVMKLLQAQARSSDFESLYKLSGNLSAVAPSHKKISKDWYAVFDPEAERTLDVDLIHSFDLKSLVCCVSYSHNAKLLATGTDQSCKVFNLRTGSLILDLGYNTRNRTKGYARSVCFSPDDLYLVVACEDHIVRVWDMTSGRLNWSLRGHKESVYTLDIMQDGTTIASGGGDGTVRLWDLAEGRHLRTFDVGTTVMAIAFSPNGQLIAIGDMSQFLSIRQVETGTLVTWVRAHSLSIYGLAFSPDNMSIASGSFDGSIKIWEVDDLQGNVTNEGVSSVRELKGHNDAVFSVAFTAYAQWVISGSKDESIQLWDAITAASPQVGQFATASADGKVRVWSYGAMNKA
ncbi:transcriptional repressor tup1 [Fusarium beomiforme]|uniref:Transcriptional repressor tup1 n=1 Tax=Fusarium beomiforme TaxID=44412 RepID=A0A9P5DWI2_9HYPO|nr:transcriptional repressor tup1 [Fusarium beomiforme]